MSNRPKIKGSKRPRPSTKIEKLKTPVRLRFYHHVGDLAGCGTIRVIQPAMIMNSYYNPKIRFEAFFDNQFTPMPNYYQNCAVITFQRCASRQQLEMLRSFKRLNPTKRVIYEIDDDLLNIPEWNFAYGYYHDNRPYIEKILRLVDGIICSTNELKKLLSPYNSRIYVSQNHLPKFIWGDVHSNTVGELDKFQKRRILYAGSHNHFDTKGGSKGDFSPDLVDFVKKTTDKYQWIFVGGIPAELKGNDDILHHEWKAVIEYPAFLKWLRPDITLAPLDDIQFNKSKSNIKLLESAALGVPCLASNIEPYQGSPHLCDSSEHMIDMIETLANDPKLRQKVWRDQYGSVEKQLFWEDNDYHNLLDHVNKHLRLLGKEL